jgi:anti-sigma B factor antagonist
MLNIIKTVENGKAVFTLEGRLDTTTASALEKELAESLEGVSELCFDFAGLDYISSAGLRVLLQAHKRMNGQGRMVLRNVGESILEIFEVTGFTEILTIE